MADETNQQRAQRRAREGLSKETGRVRDTFDADPSHGGSRGYPLWYRVDAVDFVQRFGLQQAVDLLNKPCKQTVNNWLDRLEPYEMSGNRKRQLVGRDQFLMVLYLTAYPDALQDEIAAFIAEHGDAIYSKSTISDRMRDLKYSRKRASIEAYQAFLPQNILKRDLFFNQPPPLGVNGQERRRLTDTDEASVSLEQCNRKDGVSHTSIRVRKAGHYTRGKKLTIILMIEPGDASLPAHVDGSTENPRRWFEFIEEGGTTSEIFSGFVDTALSNMESSGHPVDGHRILLWDNLASHLTNQVHVTVYGRPNPAGNHHFDIVPRPPYMPKYGPTEYIFAELGHKLRQNCQPNWTFDTMRQEVITILSQVGRNGSFNALFDHCGY